MKAYNATLIFLLFIFSSCMQKREMRFLGYAYNKDKIIISTDQEVILNKQIYGTIDKNNLSSFYESKIKINTSDFKIHIKIDSSNVTVLDTSLIISKKLKEPFVSFLYPFSGSKFERKVFLKDRKDANYIKYLEHAQKKVYKTP